MAVGDVTVSMQYSVSATPIEEIELSDTVSVNKIKSIHSKVEKSVGGGGTAMCEDGGGQSNGVDNIAAELSYQTTDSGISLNAITGVTLGAFVDIIVVKVVEANGSSAPTCDCQVSLDGSNYEILLTKVGDATLIRCAGLNGTTVKIKSSSASEVCLVDVLVGCEYEA